MSERHRHRINELSPTHSSTENSLGQTAPWSINRTKSAQTQLNSNLDVENEAFQDDKHEAFGLQLQAKYGTITAEGQERLTVLQAKMDAFKSSAPKHHRPNLLEIPNLFTPRTQAKLAIGQPGDKYEIEADSVAEQVMRMSDVNEEEELQMKPLGAAITPLVQRQCALCEEETVQRKDGGTLQANGDIESQLSSSKGGGSALPDDVRSFMEPRFGTDFSSVRVHTDSAAVQMNRELSAQAFTHGSDVYYGAGKSPGKDALTAHELTHVVQQTGGVQTKFDELTGHELTYVIQQRATPEVQHQIASENGGLRLHSNKLSVGMANYVLQRFPGDGMDPPGDCNWATYLILRGSVETAKAVVSTLGACSAGDSCLFLATKIAAITAEIAARVALDATCFKGGDTGHRQQVQDKINMMNRCYRFFSDSNCSPELIAAMAVVVERAREVIAIGAAVVAVAVVIGLIAAIIALAEVIAAAAAVAAAAAAEGAAISGTAAAIIALLVMIQNELSSGES